MNDNRKITIIEPVQQKITAANAVLSQKLRVAAYARVSTEQDEQESSYEAQVNFYTGFISSNPDWKFAGVFADKGITGTSTKNRESFNRMIGLAMNGGIDLILTKSISRFARNTVDTLQTVRDLKAVGVEVWFEKENLHTLDPKCEVMLTIMSSLAQEESRSISENIRWAQQKNMREGKVHIAYSRFLGYCKGADGRLEIVEDEAKIIRSIYDMFLVGKTIRHIAEHLTDTGIPTPCGKTKWSASTVRSILSNEKYKGDALLQKTYTVDYLTREVRKNDGAVRQYLVQNSHDPIVDPAVFDRVQERLRKQRAYHNRIRDKSPFSTRLVCADCGGFYGHKVWHNSSSGKRYDVWYCNQKYSRAEKCRTPVIREDRLREAFKKTLPRKGEVNSPLMEEYWRKTVESVTVYPDRRIVFLLSDGTEREVSLPE